jgi:hypothetical protein
MPFKLVGSVWFKHFVLHSCLQMVFLSKRQFSQDILLNFMKKTKQEYVLSKFTDCIFITTKFDLWMFKGSHDIFLRM